MSSKTCKSILKIYQPYSFTLFATLFLNACGNGSVDTNLAKGSDIPNLGEATESEIVDTISSTSTPDFSGVIYSDGTVDLNWSDEQETTEYRVYRNGKHVSTSFDTRFIDTTAQDEILSSASGEENNADEIVSTSYLYTVDGYSDYGLKRKRKKYLRFNLRHRRHSSSRHWQTVQVTPEPTDPEPTDPEPTDPEPTDPEPTDPEPTDPEPTDPEPTDPEPTDPEPTDPEPTDPEPTDPEPTDPEPTDPEPTDPEPTDPEPTDPEPTDPEPTDPEPTDPEPTDPEPTDPEPTDPEPTDPEPTDPEPTDPEPTDPEPTDPGQPDSSAIIFESDFSEDTGYLASGAGLWNGGYGWPIKPPKGWDGVKTSNNSTISVVSGAGVDGANALKIEWDPNQSQPTVSLAKHLTGNLNTGYEELYIRYHVRLPNRFKIGSDGNGIGHWKWGRLYQNTSTDNAGDTHKWSENREDSGYVVWNINGNIPYTDVNVSWAENSGANLDKGSAGGPRQKLDYFISGSDQHTAPGYFESLWDINTTDRPGELENNTNQGWHTIEFRFKLATSSNSDDGEFEMWWDGVNQGPYSRILGGGGASNASGIPTTNRGSGFNFFILFDNLTGWNADWGQPDVDGFVYINDVVVSTTRIGHDYNVE